MTATITLDERFSCAPEALWQIVGDVGRADWVPAVTAIAVESDADGDLRRMQMAGAGNVTERIYERDAARRLMVYGVVESDAQLTHHRATLEIVAGDGDGARLRWSTEVEPDAVAPFIQQAMQACVVRLREILGS